MSYPLSTYVAQIAVAANGNPQITVRPRQGTDAPAHPVMPYPVAVPAKDFPTAIAAEPYAEAILRAAGVVTQEQLVWVSTGHTLVDGRRYAARTAAIADAPTASV